MNHNLYYLGTTIQGQGIHSQPENWGSLQQAAGASCREAQQDRAWSQQVPVSLFVLYIDMHVVRGYCDAYMRSCVSSFFLGCQFWKFQHLWIPIITENIAWSLHGNLKVRDSGIVLVVAFHPILLQCYLQMSPTVEELTHWPQTSSTFLYPFANLT